MIISKLYQSPAAISLLKQNPLAYEAFIEVETSIKENKTEGANHFIINSSEKNCNGVVPVKEEIYKRLEENYNWFREKPLPYFKDTAKKGGPIDGYKEFEDTDHKLKVGIEFETGNISSAHRAMNKLCVGLYRGDIDLAILMMPIKKLAFYLTDRISNYEELEPYFLLLEKYPFIVFGFDAEEYNPQAKLLPKGKDGMSDRAIHKWKDKN